VRAHRYSGGAMEGTFYGHCGNPYMWLEGVPAGSGTPPHMSLAV
jgi:hypothetical protein